MVGVRSLTSPRTGNYVANQFVIEIGERTYFQSYGSLIAVVYFDRNDRRVYKLGLGPDWDYSRTTMKYLNEFLTECYDCNTKWNSEEIRKQIKSGDIKYCDFESELEKL